MPGGAYSAIKAGLAYVQLGADDGPLRAGLDRAAALLKGFAGQVVRVGASATAAGATVAAPLSGLFRGAVSEAADLASLATQIGATVEQTSRLAYAFDTVGVGMGEFAHLARHLQSTISNAADSENDAFRRLGLVGKELLGLPLEQQFVAIGDAISRISKAEDKARFAAEFFGRGGADTLRLFSLEADGAAESVGGVGAAARAGAEAAESALRGLRQALDTATRPGADPFARLGLSAQELSRMGVEERLARVRAAVATIANPADRAAVSLRLLGPQADAGAGQAEGALRHLRDALDDATRPAGNDPFAALGLSARELAGMGEGEALARVRAAIRALPDEAARSAASLRALGDATAHRPEAERPQEGGGQGAGGGLAARMREADLVGAVVTKEMADQARIITRAWRQMSSAVRYALLSLGQALLPQATSVRSFSSLVVGAARGVRTWVGENRALVTTVAAVSAAVVGAGTALTTLGAVAAATSSLLSATGAVVGAVWSAGAFVVKAAWATAAGVIGLAWGALAGTLGLVWAGLGAGLSLVAAGAGLAWSAAAGAVKLAWTAAAAVYTAIQSGMTTVSAVTAALVSGQGLATGGAWALGAKLAGLAWTAAATVVGAASSAIALPVAAVAGVIVAALVAVTAQVAVTAAVVAGAWAVVGGGLVALGAAFLAGSDTARNFRESVVSGAREGASALRERLGAALTETRAALGRVTDVVRTEAASAWSTYRDTAVSAWGAISRELKKGNVAGAGRIALAALEVVWAQTVQSLGRVTVAALTEGVGLLRSAWEGTAEIVANAWRRASDAVSGAWDGVVSLVRSGADAVAGAWEGFTSMFTAGLGPLGGGWGEFTSGLTDRFGSAVEGLSARWEGFTGAFTARLSTLTGRLGRFGGPLGKLFGGNLGAGAGRLTDAVGGALRGLGSALSSGPSLTDLIPGAALGSALKKALLGALGGVGSAVAGAARGITAPFVSAFGAITEEGASAFRTLGRAGETAWGGISVALQRGDLAAAADVAAAAVQVVWAQALLSMTTLWGQFSGYVMDRWDVLVSSLEDAWETFSHIFEMVTTALSETVGAAIGAVRQRFAEISGAVADTRDDIAGAFESAAESVTSAWEGVMSFFGVATAEATGDVESLGDAASDAAEEAAEGWRGFRGVFEELSGALGGSWSTMWSRIVSVLKANLLEAEAALLRLQARALDLVPGMGDRAAEARAGAEGLERQAGEVRERQARHEADVREAQEARAAERAARNDAERQAAAERVARAMERLRDRADAAKDGPDPVVKAKGDQKNRIAEEADRKKWEGAVSDTVARAGGAMVLAKEARGNFGAGLLGSQAFQGVFGTGNTPAQRQLQETILTNRKIDELKEEVRRQGGGGTFA